MKIDFPRCLLILGAGLAAVATFIWGQPLIHGNKDAVSLIVTFFSVLAGFLVGLIALTADPSKIASFGSWRTTARYRTIVIQRISRQRWMFVLYLLTIGLAFLSILFNDGYFNILIERLYFALAVMAFFLSLRLPWTISKMQIEKYDAVLEQQRRSVGIKPQPSRENC